MAADSSASNLSATVLGLRQRLHLTQEQFGKRVGVSFVTVSRWENGRARPNQLARKCLSRLAVLTHDQRLVRDDGETARPGPEALVGSSFKLRQVRRGAAMKTSLRESATLSGIISRLPLFADLDEAAIAELAQMAREQVLRKGQFLFFEGDSVECFYLVASGRLKVLKHTPSGKDFIMAFEEPGEIVGNPLLYFGRPHPSSVQASVDSRLLVIRNRDFESFLSRYPELTSVILCRMLSMAGRRLLKAAMRITELGSEKSDYRLGQVLLNLSGEFGLTIPFTRREIAEVAGTTTETAIRFVSSLKRAGVLGSSRGQIMVLDQDRLETLATPLLS